MKATSHRYPLFWKGKELGLHTVEEIRAKLKEGEISLMHQVKAGAGWLTLEEFLQNQEDLRNQAEARERDLARRKAAEEKELRHEETLLREQETALRQKFEAELSQERAQRDELSRKVQELESQVQQKREMSLLSPPSPPPYFHPGRRTSGFAVAALVMGLLNFVPFLNFITWIFAIVFGHVALSQIRHDPMLEGRGMAVAGLTITYTLIAIGIAFLMIRY